MERDYISLTAELREIERSIAIAEKKLDYASDELLIDSAIYEIESLYKRHAYYIRLCRELYDSRQTGAGEDFAV